MHRCKRRALKCSGGASQNQIEEQLLRYLGSFLAVSQPVIESLAGFYPADPALTGRANFGFVSKYKKGAVAPTGETEFQFQAGSFNFHSSLYQWLVVSGAKAQYKGTGDVNGVTGYGFLLTATDGQISGGGGVDKFRLKVWETVSGTVVYDNRLGAPDDLAGADPQSIGGGSIVIHAK